MPKKLYINTYICIIKQNFLFNSIGSCKIYRSIFFHIVRFFHLILYTAIYCIWCIHVDFVPVLLPTGL